MITKVPLAEIRAVLTTAEQVGIPEAARRHGRPDKTVYAWWYRRMREPDGWPTDSDITADNEYRARTAAHREAHAARLAANRASWYLRGNRPLYVPVTGAQRRVQALCALGWTLGDLGTRLGVTLGRVHHIAIGKNPTIHPDTDAAIRAVYRDLCMTVPAHHPPWLLDRNRRHAVQKRWALPLMWNSDREMDDPRVVPDWAHRNPAA